MVRRGDNRRSANYMYARAPARVAQEKEKEPDRSGGGNRTVRLALNVFFPAAPDPKHEQSAGRSISYAWASGGGASSRLTLAASAPAPRPPAAPWRGPRWRPGRPPFSRISTLASRRPATLSANSSCSMVRHYFRTMTGRMRYPSLRRSQRCRSGPYLILSTGSCKRGEVREVISLTR